MLHVCDVAQAHIAGHDEVAHVVDRAELADRAHQEALRPPVTSPALTEKFAPSERVAQARDVDAVGGEPHRVDQDAQLERLDALAARRARRRRAARSAS